MVLTLDTYKAKNWEEVIKAFVAQYEYNQELDVTIRDLETTRQEQRESFAGFLTRWRNKAAKMVQERSSENRDQKPPEYLQGENDVPIHQFFRRSI